MAKKTVIKRRNKEESKAKIVNAAIIVFSKYGYEKATYKSISDIAGLNESLITRYFGSKRGLAMSTLNHVRAECFAAVRPPKSKGSFSADLHAIGTALTDIYKKNVNNIVSFFMLMPMDEVLAVNIQKESMLTIKDDGRLKEYQNKGEIPANICTDKLLQHMVMLAHSVLYFVFLVLKLPIKDAERFLHFNIDAFIYGLSQGNKSLSDLTDIKQPYLSTVDRRRSPREVDHRRAK